MARILITGSNGFIGQSLASYLRQQHHQLVYSYRTAGNKPAAAGKHGVAIGAIDAHTHWQAALSNVDCVIHLAARVHIMQEKKTDPLAAFRQVNTEGTLNLARQAVAAGVTRFIYLSSIKVNGEQTFDQPFTADDPPAPQDPYAVSKYEAEQQLLSLAKETGLDVVIIRPPLVYGPGVKGNFSRLIKLVAKSLPLPLAGITNARSLVNIDNLCSLIARLISHPKAAGEVFLVSDGEDLSSSELFEQLALAQAKKSRLFYLPPLLIKWLATLLGRQAEYTRLFSSLQVDISKNKQLLDWQPEVSVRSGIKATIQA